MVAVSTLRSKENAGLLKKSLAILLLVMACLLSGQVIADPYLGYFVGDFDGRHYRVNIDRVSATSYDGILQIDDDRMQLDARRYGELMGGRLADESQKIGFRARIEGNILIMETEDGRRLVLRRSQAE